MANATKYFAEFKDLTGDQWRINIHDSQYSGTTPTEFNVGSSGFVLAYKGDTENVFQPVIGSSVEFEFIESTAAHTAFITALATANESRFTVTIQKLVSGTYELEWFGVLLSDQWSRNNEPLPRSSVLTASDDLGNLNSILYKSNVSTAYTGTATLIEHLVNALNKTRALHQFTTGDVFLRVADDFVAANTTATSRFMENTRAHHESFWNVNDDGQRAFMTTFDVIVNVCKSQNARLFLAGGMFQFVPIGTYQNGTSIAFHQYDINATFVSTTSAIETSLATGTDLVDLAGNVERFTPPLSEARRARDYNGNAPVIFEPYIAQSDFTTAITDFGVDYFSGQQINMIGIVNVTLPAVDPAFGASDADIRVGRIGVGVQFKCGTQYAAAAVSFSGQGNFGFDDGTVGTYDLPQYGTLNWSTTAGSTLFLSETFDRNAGTSQNIGLVFTTGTLPSTESSLEITLSINLVENDGTLVALDDGLNVADSPAYFVQNLRCYRADVDGGGSEITYTALGDDTNRAIKIDDTVVLGDRIGDSNRGVLEVKTGASSWGDSTGWNSLNYTGTAVGINRLAVAEILRTMRNPMPIQSGSLHVAAPNTIGQLVSMANVLEIDSDTYLFTEFAMRMNDRVLDFEVARIQRDTNTITETTSDKKNTNELVFPSLPPKPVDPTAPIVSVINSNIDDITAIQLKTNQITVTQPVDLDDMESDIATNATNVSNINGILSILKETFQPKSDGSNTITKVVYDQNKTDGLEMSLSQTTAAFTSSSGNSQLSITESSPGIFRVDLQDDGTNSVLAIYATANSNVHFVGIGTSSPSYQLDVAGRINASNGIFVNGTPVGSLNNVVDDTTPQLGGDLDGNGFNIDLSGDTNSQLIITGNQYAFRYRSTAGVLQNTGLYFNQTTGQYEFLNGAAQCIFCIKAGSGELSIGNMTSGTNYVMPTARGTNGQVLKSDGSGNVDFATFSIDDLSDVDTSTVAPTTNQVLKWNGSNWSPADDDSGGGGGGGSDSFNTISVSGQSDVVAESGNDTLTLAAGTNLAITTNATTDTITFTPSLTPTFTSILTTGNIAAMGNISAITNGSFGGTLSVGGTSSFQGKATYSAGIIVGGIEFTGNGTSTIGPNNSLPNTPDDLELRSNGNVVVVLDYDDDETGQAFEIKSGDGTSIFKIDETGVTSGLLTTATPTISGLSTSYQQGSSATATVSTVTTGRTFIGAVYNSSGVEQTSNPVTIDSSGNVSFNAPSTIATGYELRIYAVDAGKMRSLTDTATFDVTASRTFTHWRFHGVTSAGVESADRLFIADLRLYTGANATGTKNPSANATSNTSISGVTISSGYTHSSSYAEWQAFDANITTSGWWSIGNSTAANNWIQIEFSSAVTIESVYLREWTNFNYCTHLRITGSNTGNFTGEEIECGTFTTLSDSSTSNNTVTHILNI